MALFAGGLAQLLAGMWEYPRGNTFGATGEHRFFFAASPFLFEVLFLASYDASPDPDDPISLSHDRLCGVITR